MIGKFGQNNEMVNSVRSFLLGVALCALTASQAAAHSMKEALDELQQSEPYLQPMNRAAPDFTLEDAWGRKHSLADYRGKIVMLNFIYARCKEACPLQSQLLAKVQEQINATPMRDQISFVTVATDTEDAASTAEVMRDYGKAHGLDRATWVFLFRGGAGTPDTGIKVAKTYGLEFVVVSGEEQMHGVVTHVIDRQGITKARFHSLRFKPERLTAFVSGLLHSDHDEGWAGARSALLLWWKTTQYQWVIGLLLVLGFPLLVVSGLALRRYKARHRSVAPGPVDAMRDADSSRADA